MARTKQTSRKKPVEKGHLFIGDDAYLRIGKKSMNSISKKDAKETRYNFMSIYVSLFMPCSSEQKTTGKRKRTKSESEELKKDEDYDQQGNDSEGGSSENESDDSSSEFSESREPPTIKEPITGKRRVTFILITNVYIYHNFFRIDATSERYKS